MYTITPSNGLGLDYSHQRLTSGKADLAAEAVAFVASLPTELAPARLASDFPHVLNRVATLWRRPRQLDSYFQELLMDNRGGRCGFPLPVALEIASLKEHHLSVYPVKTSIWEAIHRADLA